MKYNSSKRDILLKLEDLGWSDLIDSRWKDDVIKDVYTYFPDADPKIVEEVLNIVLI